MNSEHTNFIYTGRLDGECSIQKAVQSVLFEGDGDVDSLATQTAYLLAAIMETLSADEAARCLNSASIKTWRAVEYP